MSKQVTVGKLSFDPDVMGEILFVRYMGVAIKQHNGDEKAAMDDCCEIFGLKKSEGNAIWHRRHKVITKNDAAFVASEDLLRNSIRSLYMKLVDNMHSRDFTNESVKSLIDALRTVAQIEAGMNVSRGLSIGDLDSSGAPGVNVSRSNVIIVPMPDSARERVVEVAGQLVEDTVLSGGGADYFEGLLKKREEMKVQEEAMTIPTELDPIEEAKKAAADVASGRFADVVK